MSLSFYRVHCFSTIFFYLRKCLNTTRLLQTKLWALQTKVFIFWSGLKQDRGRWFYFVSLPRRPRQWSPLQTGTALCFHDLFLMGESNHTNIFWRNHRAGYRQPRRFLECIDNNFLLKATEDPTRKSYAGQQGASGECDDKGQLRMLWQLSTEVWDL